MKLFLLLLTLFTTNVICSNLRIDNSLSLIETDNLNTNNYLRNLQNKNKRKVIKGRGRTWLNEYE